VAEPAAPPPRSITRAVRTGRRMKSPATTTLTFTGCFSACGGNTSLPKETPRLCRGMRTAEQPA
jgi:hypothetical protein